MKKCFALAALMLGAIIALTASATALESYQAYISAHQDAQAAPETIVIDAAQYSALNMENAYVEMDGTLVTTSSGRVEYTVTVPEDGLYTLSFDYFPGDGAGGDITRSIEINGEQPFSEAGELVFSRAFNDASRDYKTIIGNQPIPSQIETPQWMTAYAEDAMGYIVQPLLFALTKGENTIALISVAEGMILRSITLAAQRELPAYADYLSAHLNDGAHYASTDAIKIQAEDAALKSSPSLYPINDRTSALSEPYHSSYIILNNIGGTAWNDPGEWLAWDVEVPKDGLYRIALRFKQNSLRGMYATRSVRVNGEIPFAEAADLRFYYSTDYQFSCLSEKRADPNRAAHGETEYWFYLKEGVNRITLTVSLGELGQVLLDMEDVTANLNTLYRRIISITGSAPDQYRDYQLFTRVPDLMTQLTALRDELNRVLAELTRLTGSGSERTSGITRLLAVIDTFMGGESAEVVKRLSSFKESITSMGKAVLDLKNQPMRLDYLMVLGEDTPAVQAEGNFFQKAGHALGMFIGSFTNDYNVVASAMDGTQVKQIDVWLSTGRDQFDVIRRLINESFETAHGIKVNLKLINADVLLPSTFTGNGPEVTIQIGNTAPVNFAFRGAAYDLSTLDDYAETAAQFLPAAMESFYYKDGCYALPDQMSFPVMFYRTDILSDLGLSVPQTWDDLISLIPYLQRNNMDVYLDTAPASTLGAALSMGNSKAINTVFLSMLFERGGSIYNEEGAASAFDTEIANIAFRKWTEFYTQHDFPREIDFVTRFRIGEVPIGVVDLTTYNRLMVSAPEIRGVWSVAPVPGTLLEDGSVSYAAPCVTGAAMMIKNSVLKSDTVNEAWAFLKWWTGAETQTKYAREMEAVLGTAGRYPVANLQALETISWPLQVKAVIQQVLPTLRGIPQVPGGYITGRYLDNAFITVITDYLNPSDVLYEYTELINEEIENKRREFGLID